MKPQDTSRPSGTGLCKSRLLVEFWTARPAFLSYIRRRNRESAEDIFQDACFRFMASQAVFDHPRPAKTYFYRILHSLIVDRQRAQRRWTFLDPSSELSYDQWPELEARLLIEQVSDIIDEYLSPRDQRVLSLCLDPDLDQPNGRSHGPKVSPSTLRYHLKRIASELRRVIEDKS